MQHDADYDRPSSEGRESVTSDATNRAPQSDAIASSLRRVYQNVADEPLPDQLRDLLERLKQSDTR